MKSTLSPVLLLLLVLVVSPAGMQVVAAPHHRADNIKAPGYSRLAFVPPAVGSYLLPPLGPAVNGTVLNTGADSIQIHELMGDKLVVLSFIYTTCSDINGCPLATHVLRGVQHGLLRDPSISGKVRLLSLSFDTINDTPKILKEYGAHFIKDAMDWQFLASSSEVDMQAILHGYNQWIIKDFDEQGRYLGTISHILRVFLIDRDKQIRNIYSISFLHADMLLNDIRTLLLEQNPG
ncbi:MAG: SCO family protein [Gammaproteobacteria bacterium]|nr:SCO family protein [Gammaproteobacteria bacterium]